MNEILKGNVIYLCIPYKWNNIYYKLLYVLANVGKDIIDDCNFSCKDKGRNVFTCWNLFQSAIAAERIGESKKAQLFIDYIDKQLDVYAANDKVVVPNFEIDYPNCIYEITPEGNYRFQIQVVKDGVKHSSIITIPSDSEEYLYYGVLNSNSAENVNINALEKVSITELGNNFDIETTLEKPYIWVVSHRNLKFSQSGLPVELNSTEISDLIYYNSDELLPGVNTININEAEIN